VNILRRKRHVSVTFVGAAMAALMLMPIVHAAVPIEESVENSRTADQGVSPISAAPISRPRSLDIPPTIEPTVNTDGNPGAALQNSGQSDSGIAAAGRTSASSSGQLSELFYQLQVLQQEIQDLRGQVEEQTYLVNRLQRDQKEQYLDLDRRLMAVTEKQPAPGPVTSSPNPTVASGSSTNLSERDAYTQAFEAMRARDFDASMLGFQRLIETYPNGQYTPNAYYWIGELHLVANADPELARQAFAQVVNLYPDHQKAPDAMYKLGVVYDNLGDRQTALDFLQKVQQQHSSSPAAGLAAKYAAELQR